MNLLSKQHIILDLPCTKYPRYTRWYYEYTPRSGRWTEERWLSNYWAIRHLLSRRWIQRKWSTTFFKNNV